LLASSSRQQLFPVPVTGIFFVKDLKGNVSIALMQIVALSPGILFESIPANSKQKNMKRRILMWTAALSAFIVVLSGCTKDPLKNLTAEESRIYITNVDSTANFAAFKTYSIVDSVAVIENNKLVQKAVTGYDVQLLNSIKASMAERGYQLVNKGAKPDLGINVSRITNSYNGVMSYPDYWGYYNSFYDPFYWGYPGFGYFPPVYSYGVYQITQGGLSVEMLNLKDAPASGNKIKTVWTALARGTGVFNTSNADSQVKAFFAQSPYLKNSN
jgi:hypothetical protein